MDRVLSDIERMAKAGFEEMCALTNGVFPLTGNPFLDGVWEHQPQELRDDWVKVAVAMDAVRGL